VEKAGNDSATSRRLITIYYLKTSILAFVVIDISGLYNMGN